MVDRIGERLGGPGAGAAGLRVALGDLGHRLRYALGEYDEAPPPDTGQVDGRSYDDGTVRWQVAAEHGGHDGGWGSPPPDVRP